MVENVEMTTEMEEEKVSTSNQTDLNQEMEEQKE